MIRRWFCVGWAVLLFVCAGCRFERSVVGCWVTDSAEDYYFQLYDDGTCMMFDADDEWVSSGTYEVGERHISFRTDTGSFVWSEDPEDTDIMLFDTGETVFRYYLQE